MAHSADRDTAPAEHGHRKSVANDFLIICVGNPARGDDAAGPLVAQRLQETAPDLNVIETFQLQPEMVDDFASHTCVLVIDAQANANAPLSVRRIVPATEPGWYSHALSPEQLTGLYQSALKQPAPDTLAIGLQADTFELGAPPSAAMLVRTRVVANAVLRLCAQRDTQKTANDTLAFLEHHLLGVPDHA
jgi:hydrogenase maturation protease